MATDLIQKKLNENRCPCDICLKLFNAQNEKPDQYVKTKRGSELFFHTRCLESLKRMNDEYKS